MRKGVICGNCGKRIKKGQHFCPNCGAAIEEKSNTGEQVVDKKRKFIGMVISATVVLVVGIFIILVFCLNKCEHDFSEATCTQKPTCVKCNETEGESLGHDWTDADCTKPKTCSRCSQTEGEVAAHKYADATCTTGKKCTVCGVEEGGALGHTNSENCSRCGYVDKNVVIENAKNLIHIYGIDLDMNSVGGVDTYITWKNVSSKEIKYIHFYVQYYNSVKDVLRSEIGGATTIKLTSTGPFPQGKGNYDYYAYSGDSAESLYFKVSSGFQNDEANGWAGQYWEAPFYNTTTKYVKVDKMEIEYMDGSSYTISEPEAVAATIGTGRHPNAWSTDDTGDDYLR